MYSVLSEEAFKVTKLFSYICFSSESPMKILLALPELARFDGIGMGSYLYHWLLSAPWVWNLTAHFLFKLLPFLSFCVSWHRSLTYLNKIPQTYNCRPVCLAGRLGRIRWGGRTVRMRIGGLGFGLDTVHGGVLLFLLITKPRNVFKILQRLI